MYAATKAAVVSLSTSVNAEAPRGVRVHALCPDGVDTAMLAAQDPSGLGSQLVHSGGPILERRRRRGRGGRARRIAPRRAGGAGLARGSRPRLGARAGADAARGRALRGPGATGDEAPLSLFEHAEHLFDEVLELFEHVL